MGDIATARRAALIDCFNDDDGEGEGRQRVHGVVAVEEAVHEGLVIVRGLRGTIRDGGHGMDEGCHDEDG